MTIAPLGPLFRWLGFLSTPHPVELGLKLPDPRQLDLQFLDDLFHLD